MEVKEVNKKTMSKQQKETCVEDKDQNLYFGVDEFTLPNGDVYVGEYCAHRYGLIWREGKGKYITKDGQIYEGTWRDDKLIEKTELVITFPTGEEFHGSTVQDKYTGPGIYTMKNTMDISCEFTNNKPTGNIMLIDINGRIWGGQAGENSALLLPENQFYFNIPNDLGIGKLKSKSKQQEGSAQELSKSHEETTISDRELEKIIFAKSKKTLTDIDFTRSKWYQRYLRYRTMKDRITEKLKQLESEEDTERLTDEESKWYKKYQKHKMEQKEKKKRKNLAKTKATKVDTTLLDEFYSKKYRESYPPMKIIYSYNDREEDNLEYMIEDINDKGEAEESENILTTTELEQERINAKKK